MNGPSIHAIVLAAGRRGEVNPLAQAHAVSHKCFVPILGRPMIAHVIEALAQHPRVATISVSIEADAFPQLSDLLWRLSSAAHLRVVGSADTISDSVMAAMRDLSGPVLITTADNTMLSQASIDAVADALDEADAVIAMAPRQVVMRAHPDGQRRFYRFRDDEYSNCNLYGLSGHGALTAAEIFRSGGQFARKAGRMIGAFGLLNTALVAAGFLTLDGAMARISRRLGMRLVAVRLLDGSQAIDVDNDRTYRVTETLMKATIPAPDRAVGLAAAR